MSSINERIIYQIKNNKMLSQKGLATHLGKAQSTISQWLTQNREIPADYIIPICEYLNCSVNWILSSEDSYSPKDIMQEKLLIEGFRKLSENDREELIDILELKLKRTKKISENK